jgi:ABC-type multidrug transport system ATPase subunit
MLALSTRALTKTYKNGVQALRGIDLDVEEGISLRYWVPTAQARPP